MRRSDYGIGLPGNGHGSHGNNGHGMNANASGATLLFLKNINVPLGVLLSLIGFAVYATYQAYLSSIDVHRLPVCPQWSSTPPPPASTTIAPDPIATSPHQCDAYAPLLAGITADMNEWRHHGGITESIMTQILAISPSWEGFLCHIRDGELFVSNVRRGTESRVSATLMLTYLALKDIAKDIADTSFFVSTNDEGPRSAPHLPIFSFNRPTKKRSPSATSTSGGNKNEQQYDKPTSLLIPDFTFFAWPESLIGPYDHAMDDITTSAVTTNPWATRTAKLFWRGANSPMRSPLANVAHELGDMGDIKYISWGGSQDGKRIMVCLIVASFRCP
jgi:hypothetical protein